MRGITSKTVTVYRWVARPIAGGHTSGVSVAAFAFPVFIAFLLLFGTSPVWASNGRIVQTCSDALYHVGEAIALIFTIDNTSTTFGGPFDMKNTEVKNDLPPGVAHPTGASISKTDRNGVTSTPDIRVYYDPETHQVFSKLGTVDAGSSITITVDTMATVAGKYINRVWLTTDTFDPDPSDNESSCTITIDPPTMDLPPDMDFGDAPAPYPTLLENDGARHIIVAGGFCLGTSPDSEDDGQPLNLDALGDDEAGSNDEASVTFASPLLPGAAYAFVTAGITTVGAEGGFVNAWIDFNIDGDWADPGEHIITDEWLDSSTVEQTRSKSLDFTVPPETLDQNSGKTFARFRISSQHGLSYTGSAPDGEVEDMTVTVYMEETISLSPSTASNPVGTEHTVTATVYQLHPNNRKVPLSGKKVDFVVLGPNYEAAPHIATTDDNGNATFTYRGNKAGTDEIQARFSDSWGTIQTATAEKEWVLVPNPDVSVDEVSVDFGTTIIGESSDKKVTVSNSGDAGLNITEIEIRGDDSDDFSFLGTGDDPSDPDPGDTLILEPGDESSFFLCFKPASVGDKFAVLTFITDALGKELVEIDLRGKAVQEASKIDIIIPKDPYSGNFPSPVGSERQVGAIVKDANDKPVAGHVLTITVVDGPNKGITGRGATDETGRAFFKYKGARPGTDTLVATYVDELGVTQTSEQSVMEWAEYDFGDAPAPYPTLLKDNGARHIIKDGVYLGSGVDAESDGQPGEFANGDDRNTDDEDGVRGAIIAFKTMEREEWPLIPGRFTYVVVTNSAPGWLHVWIDFNRDGTWDAPKPPLYWSEYIIRSRLEDTGRHGLQFVVPHDAKPGETLVRFRFSTTRDLLPKGLAEDGEVEDYWHMISKKPEEHIRLHVSVTPDDRSKIIWYIGEKLRTIAWVFDADGSGIVGRVVTFKITDGPHKGLTLKDTTDKEGDAHFEYSGTAEGTDVVFATFVDSEGEVQAANPIGIEWVKRHSFSDKDSTKKPATGAIVINGTESVRVADEDTVVIGYSDPHEDGDASDTGGTPVGTTGIMISDADFLLVPPGFQGPPGTREAHTEISELSMSNADGVAVRAGTDLGLPMNPGEMESLSGASGDPDLDFPAESFFNVFLEIDLPETGEHPAVTVYNSDPLLLINNNVIALPSRMIYVTGNDSAVPLYHRDSHPDGDWSAGDLFGWLTTAVIGVDFDPDDPDDATEFEAKVLEQSDLPIPILLGDVDGDGQVRSNDALLALQFAAGSVDPTPYQERAADMNGDGKIGSNDAVLILLAASGSAAPDRDYVANAGGPVTIIIDEAHGVAGDRITVPVKIDDVRGLAAGDIWIAYNSAVLRAVDASSESGILLASNITEPGMIRIAFANAGSLNSRTLAEIQFDILADDISPLKLQRVDLYQPSALPIEARLVDGEFSSWAIPAEHSELLQNFPNPFNPETWIPYQLRESGNVTIKIFSTSGELVRELKLGDEPAGFYVDKSKAAYWDGKNEAGEEVASGLYFYNIQAGEYTATRKMVVAR